MTASTGSMTRIVEEISKMTPTTVEWTETRAGKKYFTCIYPYNNVHFTFIVCITNSITQGYTRASM